MGHSLKDYILIGVLIAYPVLVYLFPVKNGKQPIASWGICIAVQYCSLFFFNSFTLELSRLIIESGSELPGEKQLTIASAVILLVLNLIFIVLVNSIMISAKKQSDKHREKKISSTLAKETEANAEMHDRFQKDIAAAAIGINSGNEKNNSPVKTGKK